MTTTTTRNPFPSLSRTVTPTDDTDTTDPDAPRHLPCPPCVVTGCGEPVSAEARKHGKELCYTHYRQLCAFAQEGAEQP
jgi:hypothetical protein